MDVLLSIGFLFSSAASALFYTKAQEKIQKANVVLDKQRKQQATEIFFDVRKSLKLYHILLTFFFVIGIMKLHSYDVMILIFYFSSSIVVHTIYVYQIRKRLNSLYFPETYISRYVKANQLIYPVFIFLGCMMFAIIKLFPKH